MKKLALLAALLMASVTCQAIQQFQSDTTHEMGIGSDNNIFFRDPQTPPIILSSMAAPGQYMTKVTGGLSVSTTTTHVAPLTANVFSVAPVIFGSGGPGAGNIIGSSVVPVTSSYMNLLASASLTMVAKPAISTNIVAGLSAVGGTGGAIADGTYMVLYTSAASGIRITLQSNDQLSGTLLVLPPTAVPGVASLTEVITSTRPATFQYFDGINRWIQISPNNGTF